MKFVYDSKDLGHLIIKDLFRKEVLKNKSGGLKAHIHWVVDGKDGNNNRLEVVIDDLNLGDEK